MSIKAYVTFLNDPSVGIHPEYYTLEVPDFRLQCNTDDAIELETRINRETIKTTYEIIQGDSSCTVKFEWEVEREERLQMQGYEDSDSVRWERVAGVMRQLYRVPQFVHVDCTKERVVSLDGKQLSIGPSLAIHNHSVEFAWGYEGSGPAQLALAILANYLEVQEAWEWHQLFKRQYVAKWPQDVPVSVDITLRDFLIVASLNAAGVSH